MLLWILLAVVALILLASGVSLSVYFKKFKVYYERPADERLLEAVMKNKPQIVFSTTTIPSRMADLPKLIRNLQKQTILGPHDRIVINLPKISRRESCPYVITDEVRKLSLDDPRVVINSGDDYGPISKILDTLRVIKDPDARIFPVDDDCTFPPEYFEELLWYSMKDPSKVYGYHGLHVNSEGSYKFAQEFYGEVPVVETVTGVVYVRKMFTDKIFDVYDHKSPCFFTDDLVLSAHVRENGYQGFLLNSMKDGGTMRGRKGHAMTNDLDAPNPLYKLNISGGDAMVDYISGDTNNAKCLKMNPILFQQ